MTTKDFWKTVLASGLGVLLLSVLLCMFTSMIFGGIIATFGQSGKVAVPESAVLDINMAEMVLGEQTLEENPFSSMSVNNPQIEQVRTVGILDATLALKAAASDPAIKFAYIRPDMAGDITKIEEFRKAISEFRASGKPVIAYIETPTNGGYYLASVADRIYMSGHHGGMNMMVGISGRMIFLKDLLDKLGVNVQLIRHGKYKSAGEMYIKNAPSPENMEQNSVMVKELWDEMATSMAGRCGKSTEEFNALIDNLVLDSPEAFLENGLVDELVNMEGMRSRLCTQFGVENYSEVKSISLADYALAKVTPDYSAKEHVAVIYADGQILDGREKKEVTGKRFSDIIDRIAADDKVKAVVLRVNSPGGSVVASSQIKDAIDALRAKKPVIASYGSYAASGGYWISACSDYIFSNATTLTGSIGVFGMIPDIGRTVKDIAHVNVVSVPSNAHADMFGFMRPLDAEETAFVQKDIEHIYTQFTSLVAEGRKMEVEKVDELGQGRVWTGKHALSIGLIDEIGTLQDAIEYAAEKAGCTSYRVVNYPEPLTAMEQLMEMLQPVPDDNLVKVPGLGATVKALREIAGIEKPVVYARMPYVFVVD